ncbi:MAG TPA: glycosyltransferase family 2 protein [Candidatus Limnocylindria bacterium]|nr:glycosyltransferase family 2 protein [Candidatus Limnocylindria bacterium]
MAAAPDLSVVIVSYNTRDLVLASIASLERAVVRHTYEVIVSDNGSSDGTVQTIEAEHPDVLLLRNGANLGFSRAVNRALREARGDAVLLLNSDALPDPGSLDVLVDQLRALPDAGAVAPRVVDPDGSDQGTARAFPTAAAFLFGRTSPLTRMFPGNPWSRRYLVGRDRRDAAPFAVDWVSGACLMTRRAVLDRVGSLDEGFFMYWEDADWCRRARAEGYRVYTVPAARVVHLQGGSSRGRPAWLVLTFHRSIYRYYSKHHARPGRDPRRGVVAAALAARAASVIVAGALGAAVRAIIPRTRSAREAK